MNVVLFGATGMIGSGVLLECLDAPDVASVLAIGRRPSGRRHPKLREIVRTDLLAYDDVRGDLRGMDACFYCLGVSAVGMAESDYRHVTYDLAVAAAEAVAEASPDVVFCFVSGQGTDATERGRAMWARVKGMTENRLLSMPLDAYMVRPGFVQPLRGVRSRTALYRGIYALLAPLYPLLRRALPSHVTTSVAIGRALLRVAREGAPDRVLENADINRLAGA